MILNKFRDYNFPPNINYSFINYIIRCHKEHIIFVKDFCSVVQADLGLMIPLPQNLKHWDSGQDFEVSILGVFLFLASLLL